MLFLGRAWVLAVAAAIPVIFLLIKVYQLDKLEKEPPKLLIKLLILGGLSVIPAIILETVGEWIIDAVLYPGVIYNLIMYFIIVAISEECSKFVLLKLGSWKSPEFNCQFDGVVYSVFVSLGFALVENFEYVFANGLGVAALRAVTAIPGHASFAVVMGCFYGMAKRAERYSVSTSKLLRRLGVLLAILTHGFYDFVASTESGFGTLIFVVYIIIFFIICSRAIGRMAKRDEFI